MNIAKVAGTLARRWYLTLAGVLLSVGMCLAAVALVGPTYEDKATVLLLPPESSLANTGGNPYLGLNGLSQMVDVLVRSVSEQATQHEVEDRWPGAKFTVLPDVETSGPIIVITAEGQTASDTQALTNFLLARLPSDLVALQNRLDIRERSQVTSLVLTTYAEPETVRSSQLRAGIVAAAVGLAGTVLAVGVIDMLLVSRRSRRRSATPARAVVAEDGPVSPDEALDLTWWNRDGASDFSDAAAGSGGATNGSERLAAADAKR